MDYLLIIVKYIFKKNGITNDDESIDSFFDNGYSFPKLIEILYQIEQIPGTRQKPHSQYFRKINNDLSLKFIFEKDPYIKTIIPNWEGENRINLIKLILLRKYFTKSTSSILQQLNSILKARDIQCHNTNDIMKPIILLSLLSILTDDAIKIDNGTNNINFNMIVKSFQKADIPLIINENSFDTRNCEIFLIQIQMIFDIFTDEIKEINNPQNSDDTSEEDSLSENVSISIEITDDDDDGEIDEDGKKIYRPEDFNQEKNSHDFFITNPNFNRQEWYPNDAIEDEALLLTIGILAEQMKIESKDKIKSFEFTLYNNFIPLFVMRYLNIKKIDHLKKIEKKETDILTYQEIKNIKIVIDYLKKIEKEKNKADKKFEVMIFDFDSPFLFVNSAKLFFIAFLNTYFVKKTRIEMMERCHDLLGNLSWYSKTKLYTYRMYDTFAGLLSFIEIFNNNKTESEQEVERSYSSDSDESNKNDDEASESNSDAHNEDNKNNNDLVKYDEAISNMNDLENIMKRLNSDENDFCIFFNDFIELFERANVPRVIGIDILEEFYHDSDLPDSLLYQESDKELPNSIVFQLQFIFDRLESIQSLFIVERLMYANRCFKNIKNWPKPPYDVIHLKVVKKNQFMQLKKTIKSIDKNELKNKEKKFNVDEMKPKTFENRQSSEKTTKILPKMIKNDTTKILGINENDEENFWNPIDTNYLIENGIMYSKNETNQETNDFMNHIKETDEEIQNQMNFNKDKKIRKKTLKPETKKQQQQLDLAMQITKRSSSYSFVTKLYKLITFDETKMQWIFDSEIFNNFSNDKKISADESRTPLIFYFNSNEDDVVKVNSYFIMGLYPQLDSNQIFVYGLSERELSKINTTNDFSSQEKMITKPIFLILHIPKEKSKQPFIRKAISQLYFFFSSICDLSICIYNETYIKYQIELLNDLFTFRNNEKLNIALLKNNPNAEYNFKYDENVHKLSVLKMANEKIVRFYLANFDNFDSFKPFMDYLVKVSLESKTIFKNVKNYFYGFNLSHVSVMYIQIISKSSWKEELKKVIENRFEILKSKDPDFETNPEIVLSQLHKEFTNFLPLDDAEFRNECNVNYSLMRKTLTKINDDIVKDELVKSSKENLVILKKLFSDTDYWTLNQINNMINSHARFLRKEYFTIVKSISDPIMFPMIYQDNKDVLEKQIKEDEALINEMSDPIIKCVEEKNKIKKINAEETSKKGTNYTLKETENLRELKIEVKNIDKLESVIEQDF